MATQALPAGALPAEALPAEALEQSLVKRKNGNKQTKEEKKKLKPFNKNWQELTAGLEFGSVDDCKAWLQEPIFRDHWDTLKAAYLEPERSRAAAEMRPVQRGPGLEAVQKRLTAGERGGVRKYSRRGNIDKSSWDATDHLALFLYNAVEDNSTDRNGIFYRSNKTNEERQHAIWQALLRMKAGLSESKVLRKQKSDDKKVSRPAQSEPAETRTSNSSSDENSHLGEADNIKTTMADSSPRRRDTRPPSHTGDTASSSGSSSSTTPLPKAKKARLVSYSSTSSSSEFLGFALSSSSDQNNGSVKAPVDVRSTAQVMVDERISDTLDLSERYWQYVVIRQLLRKFVRPEYFERVIQFSRATADEMTAESHAWRREMEQKVLDTEMIHSGPIQAEDLEAFHQAESRLDTQATQRVDTLRAIQELGLAGGDRPRLEGMPRNIWFRKWQPVGILAMLSFQETLTGGLLCDVMGLGKTIQMVGHVLANIRRRRIAREAKKDIGPAKPHLFIVPPNLVRQTVDEISNFSQNLEVMEYWGDSRPRITAGHKAIDGTLTRDNSIFNIDQEINSRVVVVTSHPTWAQRHGPAALKMWRIKQREFTDRVAETLKLIPDWECPHLLSGRFEIVWVDEAHCIKRGDSFTSTAIQWIKPNFTGLATATPGINRIQDFKGYLKFVRTRKDPAQIRADCGVTAEYNPYEAPKEEPAAILRLTEEMAQKYIFDNQDQVEAGYYLSKLQEMVMVRRTYASEIEGECIGAGLPGLIRRHFAVRWDDEAQTRYNLASYGPLKRLVTPLRDGKIAWNAKHFRTLVLLTTWLGFHQVADQVYARTITHWKSQDDLLHQWLKILHRARGGFIMPAREDHLAQIRLVMQNAPKLRVMLAIVAEETIKNEGKICIWALFPAQQLLIFDILRKLQISVCMFSSDLTQDERDDIIFDFNEAQHPMVLICSPNTVSYGLNLQKRCNRNFHLDEPMSRQLRAQLDGRHRRIGAKGDLLSYSVSMRNTFNDRQIQNNLNKALPGIMSELNTSIFNIGVAEDSDETTELSVGDWVIINKVLMRADDPRALALSLSPASYLSPVDILRKLLQDERGSYVDIDMSSGHPTLPGLGDSDNESE